MNDNIFLENYLLILKSNVEVYNHGTLESSNDDVQKLLKDCLDSTINSQRNTYLLMVDNNIYTISNIDNLTINNKLQNIIN